MHQSDAFAIAARLYVAMRQKLGRITDVQWMLKNAEYADEVIRLAKSQVGTEMADLAEKFAASLASQIERTNGGVLNSQTPASNADPRVGPAKPSELAGQEEPAHRYVGRLR